MRAFVILLLFLPSVSMAKKSCVIERKFHLGPGYVFCGVYCHGEIAYMCRAKKNESCKILSQCIEDAKKEGTELKIYTVGKRSKK